MTIPERLLLVTHVPVWFQNGQIGTDIQTWMEIKCWAQHFQHVTFVGLLIPDNPTLEEKSELEGLDIPALRSTFRAIIDIDCIDRVEAIGLPRSYQLIHFAANFGYAANILRANIERSKYIICTVSGLVGDWPLVAAAICRRKKRRYGVNIDRVEHKIIFATLSQWSLARRARELLKMPINIALVRSMVRNANVCLLHGHATFDNYSRFSKNAQLVYNTHVRSEFHLDEENVNKKARSVLDPCCLKICYAGRIEEMKGWRDWLLSLKLLSESATPFQAVWYGAGTRLEEFRQHVENWGLNGFVKYGGFISDHGELLRKLREHHIFLFCHKTPESPRNLLEGLASGCAIVGYDGAYQRELLAGHGGGELVPLENYVALGKLLLHFHNDRARLAKLILSTRHSAQRFTQEAVYRQRSQIIHTAGF
ncbi:MAG: glycosyltransferase [Opitutaceae bacterium]|nr:glycosyltransferase [Opitutaceae bacterium]